MNVSKQVNRKCFKGLCPRLLLHASPAHEQIWQAISVVCRAETWGSPGGSRILSSLSVSPLQRSQRSLSVPLSAAPCKLAAHCGNRKDRVLRWVGAPGLTQALFARFPVPSTVPLVSLPCTPRPTPTLRRLGLRRAASFPGSVMFETILVMTVGSHGL